MKKLPLILINITVYLMLFLLSSCLPPNKTPPPVKTLPGREGSGGSDGSGGGGDTRPALYPPNNSVYVQGSDPSTPGKDALIFKGNKACLTTTSTTLNSKQTLFDSCTSPVSITITPSHTFVLAGVTYTINITGAGEIRRYGAISFNPIHFPLTYNPGDYDLWVDGGAIAAGKRMVMFTYGIACVGDIQPAHAGHTTIAVNTACQGGDYPLHHYTVTSINQVTLDDGTVYTMAPAGATLTGGGKVLTKH